MIGKARMILPPNAEKDEATRQEWMDARKTRITGSDVGAYMSGTPGWQVIRDKMDDTPPDEFMQRKFDKGHEAEPYVARAFEVLTGRDGVETGTWVAEWGDKGDVLLANPDRLVGRIGLLECKWSESNSVLRPWLGGSFPPRAKWQGIHYAVVTGRTVVYGAVMDGRLGSNDAVKVAETYRVTDYDRDLLEGAWAELLRELEAWHDRQEADSEKPPTSRVLEPWDEHRVTEWLRRESKLAGDIKAMQSERAAVQDELKAYLGDYEVVVDGDDEALVTWKTVTTQRFDSAGLKKSHPALHQEFTRPTTSRQFINKIGDAR